MDIVCLPCVKWILWVYRALSCNCLFTVRLVLLCVYRAFSAIVCLPCVKWILWVYRALSGYRVFTVR